MTRTKLVRPEYAQCAALAFVFGNVPQNLLVYAGVNSWVEFGIGVAIGGAVGFFYPVQYGAEARRVRQLENEDIEREIANSAYAKKLKAELLTVDPRLMNAHLWVRMHRDAHANADAFRTALREAEERNGAEWEDLQEKTRNWAELKYPPPWEIDNCGCEILPDGFATVDIVRIAPETNDAKYLKALMESALETLEVWKNKR